MRIYQFFRFFLLCILALSGSNLTILILSTQVEASTAVEASAADCVTKDEKDEKVPVAVTAESIPLFYVRNAGAIIEVLKLHPAFQGKAHCIVSSLVQTRGTSSQPPVTPDRSQGQAQNSNQVTQETSDDPATDKPEVSPVGNVVVVYGSEKLREEARRVIAMLDLPLSGVNMNVWGIQISSDRGKEMARVMSNIRGQISTARLALFETYTTMIDVSHGYDYDKEFANVLKKLGYGELLEYYNPRVSLLDFALRSVAIDDNQIYAYNTELFKKLQDLLKEKYKTYWPASTEVAKRIPFKSFFQLRGFNVIPDCKTPDGKTTDWKLEPIIEHARRGRRAENIPIEYARRGRRAIVEFALEYEKFKHNPSSFDPDKFRNKSENLNRRLQAVSDIFNAEAEIVFIRPTLDEIQQLTRKFRHVQYAQVGRTTVSTLSGFNTTVNSETHNFFEATPQIKLSALLPNIGQLIGLPGGISSGSSQAASTTNSQGIVGPPYVAAYQLLNNLILEAEKPTPYNFSKTGVNLTFTPYVLRDLSSAELKINLEIADPNLASTEQKGVGLNISRFGTQKLETSVYMRAVDIFDLSTFSNQAVLDGGRYVVPVIGDIWKGVFGSIPGFGNLFSFKNPPRNVLSESLMLTNAYIIPTTMGLGVLSDGEDRDCKLMKPDEPFKENCDVVVKEYVKKLENSTR